MKSEGKIYVGAHVSIAGGVHHALLHGKELGANIIQIFTANQRQWHSDLISDAEVELWKKTLEEVEISHVMSHDSYLINLASSSQETLHKSKKAFEKEILRCHQLNISFLTFHPGASLEASKDESLKILIESLLAFTPLIHKGKTRLLIENTAGQGSVLGSTFEELHFIIRETHTKIPIGICCDTCHIFAAGYDIRTKETLDTTLKEFEEKIGLKHLFAFHVNDSEKDLGAHVDRHASLGKGKIGKKPFHMLMQHPKTAHLPKYLETPDENLWKDEIQMLKNFAKETI